MLQIQKSLLVKALLDACTTYKNNFRFLLTLQIRNYAILFTTMIIFLLLFTLFTYMLSLKFDVSIVEILKSLFTGKELISTLTLLLLIILFNSILYYMIARILFIFIANNLDIIEHKTPFSTTTNFMHTISLLLIIFTFNIIDNVYLTQFVANMSPWYLLYLVIFKYYIVYTRLSFAPYILIDQQSGVFQALKKSWRLSSTYHWQLFAMSLLFFAVEMLYGNMHQYENLITIIFLVVLPFFILYGTHLYVALHNRQHNN